MNALVRRSAPGRAGATSLATAANDRLLPPAAIEALAPNAAQTAFDNLRRRRFVATDRQSCVEPPQIDAARQRAFNNARPSPRQYRP